MVLGNVANVKRNLLGSRLVYLLAIGAVYQIVFQVYMTRTLHRQQEANLHNGPMCEGEDQCLESQLFSRWRKEAEEEADLLKEHTRSPNTSQGKVQVVPQMATDGPKRQVALPEKKASASHGEASPVPSQGAAASPNGTEEALPVRRTNVVHGQGEEAPQPARMGHENNASVVKPRFQEAQRRAKANVSAFERLLQQKIARARAREEGRAKRQAEFDRLYEETRRAIHTPTNATKSLQEQLQSRYDRIRSARQPVETLWQSLELRRKFDRLVAETEALLKKKSTVSSWAQNLMATQAEMEARMRRMQYCRQKRIRGAREDDGLCLQWPSVKAWQERRPRHDVGASDAGTVFTREQLRHAEWKGPIPRVACITAVPRGAQHRVMYAVNGFNLQKYEGASELVLVYHHEDSESAQVVRNHADGVRIRGAPFFGDGQLPSTMALRYGAWSSDAEVIARWDFDDLHQPNRLSLQVRAMAAAGRPASIAVGDPEMQGAGAAARGREMSLVGEASWMREHWYPLLHEELGVLESAQAHNIAMVAAPELVMIDPLGRRGDGADTNTSASSRPSVSTE